MNDYSLGAWECLNYVLRFLRKHNKDTSLEEFETIKEQMEHGVAVNFGRKIRT
jgi:hypothetical protein